MTFKTEDRPKLLFGDDLPKTIRDISETNKTGQSLTQRYQLTLKREMFTKTEKQSFFIQKARVINKGEGRGRMFNHIWLTNKGSQSVPSTGTLLCQTIST